MVDVTVFYHFLWFTCHIRVYNESNRKAEKIFIEIWGSPCKFQFYSLMICDWFIYRFTYLHIKWWCYKWCRFFQNQPLTSSSYAWKDYTCFSCYTITYCIHTTQCFVIRKSYFFLFHLSTYILGWYTLDIRRYNILSNRESSERHTMWLCMKVLDESISCYLWKSWN